VADEPTSVRKFRVAPRASYVPLDQLLARFRAGRSGWHKTKFCSTMGLFSSNGLGIYTGGAGAAAGTSGKPPARETREATLRGGVKREGALHGIGADGRCQISGDLAVGCALCGLAYAYVLCLISYMLCAAHCACASAGKLLTGNTGSFCEQQPLKAPRAPCGPIPQYGYKILYCSSLRTA
jgi:hypothetical protein